MPDVVVYSLALNEGEGSHPRNAAAASGSVDAGTRARRNMRVGLQ